MKLKPRPGLGLPESGTPEEWTAILARIDAAKEAAEKELAEVRARRREIALAATAGDPAAVKDGSQTAQAEAPAPVAKVTPPAPPSDPAAAAYARQDTALAGLAIVARESPEKGSRRTWLHELGRHLAPGASQAEQRAAALRDPRGQAFAEARQQCLT